MKQSPTNTIEKFTKTILYKIPKQIHQNLNKSFNSPIPKKEHNTTSPQNGTNYEWEIRSKTKLRFRLREQQQIFSGLGRCENTVKQWIGACVDKTNAMIRLNPREEYARGEESGGNERGRSMREREKEKREKKKRRRRALSSFDWVALFVLRRSYWRS